MFQRWVHVVHEIQKFFGLLVSLRLSLPYLPPSLASLTSLPPLPPLPPSLPHFITLSLLPYLPLPLPPSLVLLPPSLTLSFPLSPHIQLSPRFPYAHTLLGHEYVMLKDFEKAMSSFQTAVSLDPRHYNAWCVCVLRLRTYVRYTVCFLCNVGVICYHFRG